MGLRDLLADKCAPDITVSGMTLDSRLVRTGDAFVAVPLIWLFTTIHLPIFDYICYYKNTSR